MTKEHLYPKEIGKAIVIMSSVVLSGVGVATGIECVANLGAKPKMTEVDNLISQGRTVESALSHAEQLAKKWCSAGYNIGRPETVYSAGPIRLTPVFEGYKVQIECHKNNLK